MQHLLDTAGFHEVIRNESDVAENMQGIGTSYLKTKTLVRIFQAVDSLIVFVKVFYETCQRLTFVWKVERPNGDTFSEWEFSHTWDGW